MFFSKVSDSPKVNQQRGPLRTNAYSLPIAADNEDQIEVICALQETSPYEYVTLAGITFHKVIYPSERSYVDNKDKQYGSGYLVLKLTKKQIDSLLQEAQKRQLPTKKGLINLADIIILTPFNDFKTTSGQQSLEKFYDHSNPKTGSSKKNQ